MKILNRHYKGWKKLFSILVFRSNPYPKVHFKFWYTKKGQNLSDPNGHTACANVLMWRQMYCYTVAQMDIVQMTRWQKYIYGFVQKKARVGAQPKNVAPQNQIAICKPRAQYAKRNCAFKLFKAHYAATINAKNTSFHKKF